MSVEQEQRWITGEEFQRERRRLIDAGVPDDAPEFQALMKRVRERDDYLYERYGRRYLATHSGQWISISPEGEVIIRPRLVDVLEEAGKRFGPGSSAIRKLADFPGMQIYH